MRWLRSIFQLEINPGFVMAALVVSVCSVTVFTVTFDQFRQGVVPPPFEVKQIKVEVRPSTLELVIIKRRNAQCLTDIRDFILRLPDEDVAFAYPAVSGGYTKVSDQFAVGRASLLRPPLPAGSYILRSVVADNCPDPIGFVVKGFDSEPFEIE